MTTSYTVLAAFPDERRARRVAGYLAANTREVHVVQPGTSDHHDRVSELRAEMREEVVGGWAAPPVGFLTHRQGTGAFAGALSGAIVGAVLGVIAGLVWGLADASLVSPLTRFVIAIVPFVVGGSVAGAVAGGSLLPRRRAQQRPHTTFDDQQLAGERDTVVAVHVSDEDDAQRLCRLLTRSGADRVDAVDDDGNPLPPLADP